MQYITSVSDYDKLTKHIIEVNGKNVEVVYDQTAEQYGDKKGEYFYRYGRYKVYEDLSYVCTDSRSIHLAEPVIAIELVRFLIGNKDGLNF